MSRRRDLSTDISTDGDVDELSDIAALIYTWSIPHANEDASLTPKTPKEIKMLIVPGRDWSLQQVSAAMEEIFSKGLWLRDEDGLIFFPPETFYKYQNKIAVERRRPTGSAPRNPTKPHETQQTAADVHETLKNPVSSSFSSSSSSSSPPLAVAASRARESNDMGLSHHPKELIGDELWDQLCETWRKLGKPIGIIQAEGLWYELIKLQDAGNDPREVVRQTCTYQYRSLRPVINVAAPPNDGKVMDASELRRRAAARAAANGAA